MAAIPYENLDILLGRGVELDLEVLQAKLLGGRRGGYCFEHNLLFAALLERLGFEVTRLAARVVMAGGPPRPRTHMLMRVGADGHHPWLADVGFGGEGPLEPMPLEAGAVSRQGGWSFRLRDEDAGRRWTLQTLRTDGWFDLYRFTLEPQLPIDYVMANHYASTHPRSPFTGAILAHRMEPHRRFVLRGRLLTEARPDGAAVSRTVADHELGPVLADPFRITLTDAELARLRARP